MTPTATLTKSGMGKMSIDDNVRLDRLAVLAGELELVAGSSGRDGVSVVNRLDVPSFHVTDVVRPPGFEFDPGLRGTIDLKAGKLIVQNGAVGVWTGTVYSGVQGLVQHAYDFVPWT